MAPSRMYFARLETEALPPYAVVPITQRGDLIKPFVESENGSLAPVPGWNTLADSENLLGTLLNGRPATVGDLRAGRAADVYWSIEGYQESLKERTRGYWKSPSAICWCTDDPPADPGAYAFEYVVHAEVRMDGTWKVLDRNPEIHAHARKFRAAMNKESNKASEDS